MKTSSLISLAFNLILTTSLVSSAAISATPNNSNIVVIPDSPDNARIGSDYSTDPSLLSDEYYLGSIASKNFSGQAVPANRRPLSLVRAFADSLSSTRSIIHPSHAKFPQNYFIPDGTGPLRWSCVYSTNNVAMTPWGTQLSIAHSNGFPTPAPLGSHRPPHPGKPYSCGQMVNRNRGIGYGKYSIDMIPTDVVGHVTAFFLITHGATPNGEGSEIDIELTGLNSTVVWLNIWKGAIGHPVKIPLGFDASKGWHNYAIEWQPGFIAWSVDGKEVLRRTDVETTDPRLPEVEYRLSMNSWTHDVADHWAGKFEWPAGRGAVMGQF
ncbi:hypothetical protein BGZ95_005702, partial [Linnemannia exigua]